MGLKGLNQPTDKLHSKTGVGIEIGTDGVRSQSAYPSAPDEPISFIQRDGSDI